MPSYTTSGSSEYFITTTTGTSVSTAASIMAPPPYAGLPPHLGISKNPTPKKKNVPAALEANGLALASELLVYYKRNQVPGRYEEGHRHNGETAYQNLQDLLARFFISVHYNAGPINNWREWCIGMTSYVTRDNLGRSLPENMHMPMFDYDGKNIKSIVRKDVQQLQKKWSLGPATLFQTKKGFHVYFMADMVSWGAYQNMLSEVKCCEGFRNCALKAGYAVLRVSAKYSAFDITLDSVMQPEVARALPFRKIRKARMVEAILSLGERCGTHFASLCPEWAHYHEDIEPWKQPTRSKRAAGKMLKPAIVEEMQKAIDSKYGFRPGKKSVSVGKPKGKLVLKPLAPQASMSEVKYYNPALPKYNPYPPEERKPLAYPVKYEDSGAIAEKMASVKYASVMSTQGTIPVAEVIGADSSCKLVADMNQSFSIAPSKNETIEFKGIMFDSSMNYVRPSESPSEESEDDRYAKVQKAAIDSIREMASARIAQELDNRQFVYQSTKDLADET